MFTWFQKLKRGQKHDLSSILSRAKSELSYSERVKWLEQLVDWIRHENPSTRLKFLIQVLDRNPEWKIETGALIASLVSDSRLTRLFSETGVPSWMSMTHEFMSRFIRVFLPPFSDDELRSGKDSLGQVFYERGDGRWVRKLPREIWQEFMGGVYPYLETAELRRKVESELIEASLILSMKCGSIMVREDFALRAPVMDSIYLHPALRLQKSLSKSPTQSIDWQEAEAAIAKMDEVCTAVRDHLEKFGVSIDLVFQRERLKQYVARLEVLLRAIKSIQLDSSQESESSITPLHSLFFTLVSGSASDQDFSYLMRKNLSLLSKKVVDFTGSTGGHYIAHTPQEMKKLFWGAVGGGAVTAFAVLIKYGIDRSSWPLFFDFLYAGVNYSIAFLVIHFLHFTLATKQPSMTAATLAGKIHQRDASGKDDQALADEIKQLVRSQSASIIGNIIAVIPVCIVLEQIWCLITGHPFFNVHESEHLIQAVSPWRSGAVMYACMTGGLLWMGGITSGWIENAAVYHRIPKLIENHKMLHKIFGRKNTSRLSQAFQKNISGVTSSVSLGFMLAAWPNVGRFFGLPLDIRHVTFSTGAVAAAVSAIGPGELKLSDWTEIVLGIAMIGCCNFAVSFLLALTIAVRAKEMRFKRALSVLKRVLFPAAFPANSA